MGGNFVGLYATKLGAVVTEAVSVRPLDTSADAFVTIADGIIWGDGSILGVPAIDDLFVTSGVFKEIVGFILGPSAVTTGDFIGIFKPLIRKFPILVSTPTSRLNCSTVL
jgi:hypothetical protein